jgi:peptidoglycan LD-endopeptidase CwlK
MSRDLFTLTPDMVEKCLQFLKLANTEGRLGGLKVKVISTGRSQDEQAALFAKGRTRPGEPCQHLLPPKVRPVGTCKKHPLGVPVTWAVWGKSPHNYGLAFDVCFTTNGKDVLWDGPWNELAAIGASVGLEWGGAFPAGKTDNPHFQLTNWKQFIPKE